MCVRTYKSDNPFDEGKCITGLANKKRKARQQRERQCKLDRIEKEKDEDIKAELREGNVIKDYS